tara:strand:+ start:422 stop:2365 length:1944 start_codon:yes stop_codon:yes gene_type:complete
MPLVQTRGAASAQGFGEFAQATAVNYIEDVFSTYLYTGTGSALTITNSIDLSTKGGLVWNKPRTAANYPYGTLTDTVRGVNRRIIDSLTDGEYTNGPLSAFNSNGFTINSGFSGNTSSDTYASWTFREQAKFFDVVTYTGTGSATTIAHNLGSVPGCIIVKRTDTTAAWAVYHRSLANTQYLVLNSTAAAATGATWWNSTTPTSAVFSVGTDASVNASGGTYVAYIFAHDAGGFGLTGTDNVISCGSFTTPAYAATVNLGYEPQWILTKKVDGAGSWEIIDNMRGLTVTTNDAILYPNLSQAEAATQGPDPTSTGFKVDGYPIATYIYIAIRRGPMKVPTLGTSVYENTAYTGNNTAERKIGSSVLTDLLLLSNRDATATDWSTYAQFVFDRLRGQNLSLSTSNTNAQVSGWNNYCNFDMNTGWDTGSTADQQYLNKTSATYVSNAFKRAPGFFDVVCYTGTGVGTLVNHNLAVKPELIIYKSRSAVDDWPVNYTTNSSYYYYLYLNTTAASSPIGVDTDMTSTTITPFRDGSGVTYVAYLFATCPGVSKVGSYTGNGSTQTINCGFTGGARFVLIKRTDATSGWYVYDTARGMTVLTDPYLLLNSTAAEVATLGSVTTVSTGFALNSAILAAINVSAGTYIFLAIA